MLACNNSQGQKCIEPGIYKSTILYGQDAIPYREKFGKNIFKEGIKIKLELLENDLFKLECCGGDKKDSGIWSCVKDSLVLHGLKEKRLLLFDTVGRIIYPIMGLRDTIPLVTILEINGNMYDY